MRARRYQEAKEREWRAKEKGQAERQVAMMSELADAREAQKNSKLKQRADMARVEHSEFMRVLTVNREKEYEDLAQVGGGGVGGRVGGRAKTFDRGYTTS